MADKRLFEIDPTSDPLDNDYRIGWGKAATATINQTVTQFFAWLKTNLVASTTEPGLVEKATSGELASGTIDKYIDAKLLSDGVLLGSNPTFSLVTGATVSNNIRKNGATKHLQLTGTMSYSANPIPKDTIIMTLPITSWSPTPAQDVRDLIWIYIGTQWYAYKCVFTTSRTIKLLEATGNISTDTPFSINIAY